MEKEHMQEHLLNSSIPPISKSRLEMLYDGIFAIAMTILVLELKVPEIDNHRSSTELWQMLYKQGATFGSYILSFFILGNFWYVHNHQFRYIQKITKSILALHFLQLAIAAVFPFCAALIGRYPLNPVALLIYTGSIMADLWTSLAQWVISKRINALIPELDISVYNKILNRQKRGAIVLTMLFLIYVVRAVFL